jgi:hypothetical protein
MPTANQRSKSGRKGGAAMSSNETPVSTSEQPNPPGGDNTKASRPAPRASQKEVSNAKADRRLADPADKANGRDAPSESEHDHTHQKLHGTSSERLTNSKKPL